jgi:hypothetical protein
MPYTTAEAGELGEHRGYQAANYAANVTREPVREPARADEPAMSDEAWLSFSDGWDRGIEAFERDDDETSADPEPVILLFPGFPPITCAGPSITERR